MSLLKEVMKRKPIAESVTGIKLFHIVETLEPGTRVVFGGKQGIIKKKLKGFGSDEPMYMIIQPGRKVTVAARSELRVTKKAS